MSRGSSGGHHQTTNGGHQQPADARYQQHGQPVQQPGNPERGVGQSGNPERTAGKAAGARGATGGDGNTTLQAISVIFALFGALSLYAGFETLRLGGAVPMMGAGLRILGLVVLVLGAVYLYAAYGIWTNRRWGWRVGMWLVAAGGLVCVVGLLAGGAAGALVGLLFNGALGWGLHTNREPFREHPLGNPRRAGTGTENPRAAEQPGDRQTGGGATGGYASERRGRH